MKIENIDFSNRPHVGHLIKESWDMYFIGHVTPQNQSVEMSCLFLCESTSQHVTTLKSLVTIGILIVEGKMLHQKRGTYKYVVPLKNWVDWRTTRQEKYITSSKMHILGRSTQILKTTFFTLMTTFYDFALKIKTSWAKKDVKSNLETWNVDDVVCVWYLYSQIKKKKMKCKTEQL